MESSLSFHFENINNRSVDFTGNAQFDVFARLELLSIDQTSEDSLRKWTIIEEDLHRFFILLRSPESSMTMRRGGQSLWTVHLDLHRCDNDDHLSLRYRCRSILLCVIQLVIESDQKEFCLTLVVQSQPWLLLFWSITIWWSWLLPMHSVVNVSQVIRDSVRGMNDDLSLRF